MEKPLLPTNEPQQTSLVPLYIVGLSIIFNFTIFSPTILPFITLLTPDGSGSLIFAIEISLNAFAQVMSSFFSGVLSKRFSMKKVITVYQLISLLGSSIYCFALWPFNSVWLVVLSRFVVGVQGGIMGLAMSYISTVVEDKNKRAISISNFRAICVFGVLPTSIIAGLLTLIPAVSLFGIYDLNEYTSPSWVNVFVQGVGLLFCFRLVNSDSEKANNAVSNNSSNNNNNMGLYKSTGVTLSFLVILFFGYSITSMTYLMPIVLIDGYKWSPSLYSIVTIIFSIVGILGALSIRVLVKLLKQRLYIALVPAMGGIIVMMVISSFTITAINQVDQWLAITFFVVGVEGGFFFFNIAQSVLSSSFTQIVPKQFIVTMVPLLSAIYAIGKIVGPIICALEVRIMGIGLVYFVYFIVAFFVLSLSFGLSKHWAPLPPEEPPVVVTNE